MSKATPINGAGPAVGEPPAAATPQPQQNSDTLGGWADRNLSNPDGADEGAWGMARGVVKSAGQTLGGLIDLIRPNDAQLYQTFARDYKMTHPQATDGEIKQAYPESVRARIAGHMQGASQWLRSGSEPQGTWENVGAIGEQVLEFVGPGELLKMAGGGVQAASKAASVAEDLKGAQQVATILKSHPKLAGLVGIGLKALQDGSVMGAQTYLHTEDPGQAAAAGALGGGASLVAGAGGRYITKIAPKNLSLAGEKIPALASQVNEAGLATDTGAAGAPAIAQAQQQGGQAVIQNVAQQATAQAIDRINQSRPVFGATIEDAGRMLPAPEGSQPVTFTLETPPSEAVEGDLTSPAEEIPRSHTSLPEDRAGKTDYQRIGTQPEYIQPGGEGGAWSQRTGQSWAERRIPGYMHTGPEVEGAADVTRTGNLQTTNPAEAQSWLRQLEDLQNRPEFADRPEAEQAAIKAQATALDKQLGIYHASPYAQRFVAENPWDAMEHVRHFGDAADQIEGTAQPVYATLDRVSGGEFNKYKEAAKQAQAVLQRSTSVEAYDGALTRLRQANGAVEDIIHSNRGAVSMQDYMAAKDAWRMSSRLNELHATFEGMMNGVTADESEQGLSRVMTGKAKNLERYLADDTNREQIQQLIGKDGILNLKQITLLLSKANTARATQNVLRDTWSALAPHVGRAGAGAMIGYAGASAMGADPWKGAAAGAITADGLRYVLRAAATSPRIGNMVDYAVRNGLSAQHYAPLIARAIAEPFQQQAQPTEKRDGEE